MNKLSVEDTLLFESILTSLRNLLDRYGAYLACDAGGDTQSPQSGAILRPSGNSPTDKAGFDVT